MNALPGAYVTWTESAEPLEDFQRYILYRRELGDADWVARARITDRSITYFQDYRVGSGTTYEYAVTQVSDASGEEVESDFPTAASTVVTITSFFIHDDAAPENYVEVVAQGQRVTRKPDAQYLQVWGRQQPTAHVGQALSDGLQVSLRGVWNATADSVNRATWDGVKALMERQRLYGSVFMARQGRDVRAFCAIDSLDRTDEPMAFGLTVSLTETYLDEASA